jgi:hypothetical protein
MPYYRVIISEFLKNTLKLDKDEYRGVFDLDLAQNEESLDFFALGHPLITKLSEFCKDENLGNPSAILKMNFDKALKLPDTIIPNKEKEIVRLFSQNKIHIWMFVFELEYNGIVIEKIIRPILITSTGIILEKTSQLLIRPHNFMEMVQVYTDRNIDPLLIHQKIQKFDKNQLEELHQKSKDYFKKKVEESKYNIAELNETLFKKELQRLLSLYEYKREYIQLKMSHYKAYIEKLQNKSPTKRQWENLDKIDDKDKRKEKEDKYNSHIKMVQNANTEMDELKKQLESLEFDLPEDIKRLEFYRKLTKRIWLSQFALLIQ